MHLSRKAGRFLPGTLLLIILVVFFGSMSAGAGTVNMIAYANSKGTPDGSLEFTSKGVRFRYADNSYAKSTWIKVKKDYYCFNKKGYAEEGWFKYSGNTYYAASKGRVFHESWHKEGGSRFYFKANGVLAKGQWVTSDGKVYMVDGNGRMITNKLFRAGGNYYYVNKNGQRVENAWVVIGGKNYFFNAKGERMTSTWIKYRGQYYYVKADGSMAVNEDIGKYHVGRKGALDGYAKAYAKYAGIDYLFVGDSRTVGMGNTISDPKSAFIGKVGEGYNWLKSTADKEVRTYLKYNPKVKVIFGFGVNDLGNVSRYISYFNDLIKAYPQAKIYILSVNPIVESKWKSKYVSNKGIRNFNDKIFKAFKSRYINTFTYLCKSGYDTVDGLHYTADTYRKIYDFAKLVAG